MKSLINSDKEVLKLERKLQLLIGEKVLLPVWCADKSQLLAREMCANDFFVGVVRIVCLLAVSGKLAFISVTVYPSMKHFFLLFSSNRSVDQRLLGQVCLPAVSVDKLEKVRERECNIVK